MKESIAILPNQTLLEVIHSDESCVGLSVEEVMDVAAKSNGYVDL